MNPRHDSVQSASADVHRARDASAGSFSYRHSITYTAVRDIEAGEELTVDCGDDDYDGGAYFLSRYPSDKNNNVCLDQNLHVGASSTLAGQRGLIANRDMTPGTVLISTPLVPLHRNEWILTMIVSIRNN